MCLKSKNKKPRAPLQPRKGPYHKVNAYTLKPCRQQIMTLVLVIILVILHAIFNVGAIFQINNPILFIMFSAHYLLIVLLAIIYILITNRDPVDDLIIDRAKRANVVFITSGQTIKSHSSSSASSDKYKYCKLCLSQVHFKSYHCKRCNRCTQKFDHHCVYLNTCIGSKNYELFILIVMAFITFLVNLIGQNIWIFVVFQQSSAMGEQLRPYVKTQWMLIVIIILSSILLILSLVLCVFHFYMSCCLDITTLEFIQSQDTESNKSPRSIEQYKINRKQWLENSQTKRSVSDSLSNNLAQYNESLTVQKKQGQMM